MFSGGWGGMDGRGEAGDPRCVCGYYYADTLSCRCVSGETESKVGIAPEWFQEEVHCRVHLLEEGAWGGGRGGET